MDGRCETCRWWDTDEFLPPRDDPEIAHGWGICQRVRGKNTTGSRAVAFTFDPYENPMLWTAPDFGCVQHQQKEP